MKVNRRYFFQSAAGVAVSTRPGRSANNRVNVAVIGIRGRGKGLANSFASLPDVSVEYLVDVDPNVLDTITGAFESKHGKRPKAIADMRRAFDDKSIDAVVIATPDHWHAPAAILACDAGKDVYVEKPCSHNVREGRLLVEAARRARRIVQHGTQARSRPSTVRAIEVANSGAIGKVLMAKAWDVQLRGDIGHKPDSLPPKGLDYENWVGPAEMMPFNLNRFHYTWHWHWNYGTGDMGNDGAHQVDQALWALGVDYPTSVSGMGRKLFFQDQQATPDTMDIQFNYPDKVMIFEMRIWNPYKMEGVDNGVAIYGSDGMVQIGRWDDGAGYKVFDKKGKVVQTAEEGSADTHQKNFIDCVRSRRTPNAEIEIGHRTALHLHLGNIVARTGRTIRFDSKTESIIGDPEANQLLSRKYRDHWARPKG